MHKEHSPGHGRFRFAVNHWLARPCPALQGAPAGKPRRAWAQARSNRAA
ncbi:hypothetical protein C4K40_3046 [Pseudomonas sp. CMR5c]|nr:hypothetical protein C4K40_3046 [Pseudomonas sp. CMR5c]